ncbi:MAG: hypothetical protein FWE82_00835 [Defluviitaleaceae bacterium]|nr:hypothetical protein [Defluviitaleaceae bacterium]
MYFINTGIKKAEPLDTITIRAEGRVEVSDSAGRVYFKADGCAGAVSFVVGGALGRHEVRVYGEGGGLTETAEFFADAKSGVADKEGVFAELFAMCEYTMRFRYHDANDIKGAAMAGVGKIPYKGKEYYNFVVWILDHLHTAKGFKYISPHANGLVDLLKEIQREDGMIWSFVYPPGAGEYYLSAYEEPYGFAKELEPGGFVAARQPVENHCEYNYVECVHLVWKSGGDDDWMKGMLESCKKALDYGCTDKMRWSEKFGLLKRGYTIDSWDFQPYDEYFYAFPLGAGQQIHPEKTKYTIFYGDNTGYALACDELAEMLRHAGSETEAKVYETRAAEIRAKLDKIAWNGKFYRHRVEEDESVVRDLGADESKQISFSNCYTLNRGCTREQAAAIIESYIEIKNNLPNRSPGEFYAIYPPFEKPVFDHGGDCGKWQYMNGGVHGHAAGELARGAFANGYESYGADILRRVNEMAKPSKGFIRFAYTGGYDAPPPPQKFTVVSIKHLANMSLSHKGAVPWMYDGLKNDIGGFPVGSFSFDGVPYTVAEPDGLYGTAAAAVSVSHGLPRSLSVPLDAKAGSVYLLHATAGCPESGLTAMAVFVYADGSEITKPIKYGDNITNFWFSSLPGKTRAGVAWKGDCEAARGSGVCWAEFINPQPDKEIKELRIQAGPDGAVYAVLGVTLSDSPRYIEAEYDSGGGPDNWSGGLCLAALMEGLGGVTDNATKYSHAAVAPRWSAAGTDEVKFTARYAASDGYVSYKYLHEKDKMRIKIIATGSGSKSDFRVLLPEGSAMPVSVKINGVQTAFEKESVRSSMYAVFNADISIPSEIEVDYFV